MKKPSLRPCLQSVNDFQINRNFNEIFSSDYVVATF